MHLLSVVGARPQFIKLAVISQALDVRKDTHTVVHTGQHYDPTLSSDVFEDLGLPKADVNLAVGSGKHGAQTAEMIHKLEFQLEERSPDMVVLYGDTNSTLAGAIAASKLHLPIAHLEAGLRSGNRRMPEELNRILTDHASDVLLAPTATAMVNLRAEGLADRAVLVGDVMADLCLRLASQPSARRGVLREWQGRTYILATLHRASNTDDRDRLRALIESLSGCPLPVVLPVHPRLRDKSYAWSIRLDQGCIHPRGPLNHTEMLALCQGAAAVVTDSGGLQKEAYLMGVPCTTLRSETEWPETLYLGWNVVTMALGDELRDVILRPRPVQPPKASFGGGDAGREAVNTMRNWLLDRGADTVKKLCN